MDTTTSTGKLLLGVLASIAEFETDIRKERQREGIDKAKANGVYRGRRASVDAAAVRALHSEGVGPSNIAKRLGIGRASVSGHSQSELCGPVTSGILIAVMPLPVSP